MKEKIVQILINNQADLEEFIESSIMLSTNPKDLENIANLITEEVNKQLLTEIKKLIRKGLGETNSLSEFYEIVEDLINK